ncbi:amino acid adenylation domain-containing protein, partial [Pseudoalteromonas luteoviolacea]
MNIKNLVAQLKSAGAQVIKQQGKWSVRLPKTLSPQLKQQIQENKVALKSYLQSLDQLGSEDNRIRASKIDSPAPLSSAQRRLWFLDRVQEKGSAEYHIFVVLALQGRLDLAAATQAIEAIIARHEILSTSYTEKDNEPVQSVVPQAPFVISTTSLDGMTDLTEENLHELFRQEVERPFDLQAGPLFRVSYFDSASDDSGYLLVNMHHILADGWSLELFNQEFISNYEAILGGKMPSHPELPIQYKDYAIWQNEQLQDGQLAQQLNYWSEQLAELPLLHNLAQTKLRPKVKQHVGNKLVSQFSSATMAHVTNIAQHYGVSPFVFVHAILALLFSRHSNSDDIVVGLPVANRNQPELASLIGCFVNTLVLRVNTAQSSFSDYMAHVKRVHREALENQEVPLELIIEQLGIPRSLSATPAFQILLTANSEIAATTNSATSPKLNTGVAFQELRLDASSVKTDLDIAVHTTAEALTVAWNFDVALFSDTQIARMQRHFETLLESVLTLWQQNSLDTCAPEALPMLSLAEQQALVLRGTALDEQATGLLHARFDQQVEAHPDRIAVHWQDKSYSYGQLGRKVEQLSQMIGQALAGQRGQLIGVCMARSTDMVIAMLAILRAGAGYVPLDPEYPKDRINYMLGDTQVPVVLTDPSSEGVVADYPGRQICLDNFADRDLQQASSIKESQQAPNWRAENEQALAYVIYTSGSTGQPKGVMVTHSNAVAMLSWAEQEFSGSATRRMLAATSINFDLSVFEIFLPLSLGHSLMLVDNILAVTKSDDITLINTVPSAMQTLLDTDCLPETVEVVNLAGEPLQKQLVNRIFEQQSQIRVYNLYGPSEDTTYSTYARFDVSLSNTPHIGQPIAGTQAYVFDRNLQLTPEQVSGELYLGGAGVTAGYLNKAPLTEAVFINNPYYDPADQHSSPYLYKTGDLVRLRSDANLDYLGRSDSQVKIHGYRIELGEIEHHLDQIAEIDSSVALVTEQANGHSQILAFVKSSANASVEPDGLLKQLSKALPAYMVPHSIQLVVEWPYTSNGKIDKQALRVTSAPTQHYQKPVTKTEQRLAAIWSTLLCCEVEKIGSTDGFFSLGGNSLLSAKLAAQIADEFQLTIKISEIFEHQQLAQLAACIDDKEHDTHTDAIVAVPRSTEGHTLSMAQHRLWMLDQSLGGSHQYNIPMAYTIEGTLDLALAEQALNDIVRRHEVLRTRYVEKAGQVVQIPCEQAIKLEVFDLSEDSSTDQQARCDTILSQQARNTFDLENEGVIRAGYIRLRQASGAQEGVLYCVIHHIAFDGESQHIFYREFVSRYAQLQSGSAPALDMLPLQYIDYALWEHSQPRVQQLAGQTQYWLEQLADLPQLHSVPGDFPRPPEMSLQGATYTQPLSIALGEQLHDLAAAQGCTLFMVFHAAFSILLARYSNESDIVLGMPVSGRHHPQCRELIGLFVNTLILRTDVDPCSQFSEYLQDVKRINLAAHDNQDVQLQTLLELLAPTRSSAHAPLFQMVISMNSDHSEQVRIPDLNIVANEIENKTAKFDLILHISESQDGIGLAFEYSKDLFAEATIVRMMGHFTKLLDEIVIAPDTPIAHLPIVSEEEKKELIHELNPASDAHPDTICMHELFYRQTWLTPDATALIAAQGQLSYRQLYHQARQIAMQLSQYELSSECLVAVRIPKGPMQAVATMAILMAGGAYLPLEVSWPQARCEKILNKAGCSLLLLSDAKHGIEQAGVVNITLPQIDFTKDDYADEALPAEIPEIQQSATDLAYVIFTSGSTGEPKGVEIEHHAAVNTLLEINQVYQVDEKDAILAVSALSFDLSVYDIFGLLAAGGAVVFPDADKATDPEHWLEMVERYNVTLWDTVPSSAGLLAEQLELQERCCTAPLRHVMMSGDWIPPSLPRRLWDRFSACQVHSMGGATEGSIWSIHYPVTTDPCNQKSIPYGKPLYGQSFYILTQSGQFVPKGNIGELHIGGRGVARGYCGAPELTSERFIWHPELQQTLYRTGDLGRYMADGNIEFLGRVDHQVKIRGFRVELAEIEYQVKQHEAVKDALVVVSELQGAAQLIAYVIPETQCAEGFATQLVPQLKRYLHTNLTDYMVPAVFVPVAQWPVTANGKVDKKALPAPSDTLLGAAYQAPQTEIERILQKLWAELLQLDCEQVSTTANFFELGGDSILSIQLVSRAARAGLHFSARALFEAQTIRQLAPQVQSQAERLAEQGPVSGLQPLLPIQQQLLADSTDVHHFNQAVLLTPTQPLSQPHLISLVAALYGRHDALSVRYQSTSSEQWQGEYTPQRDDLALARTSVSRLDLSELSEAQYQNKMDQLQASFVLSEGRLLQAVQV